MNVPLHVMSKQDKAWMRNWGIRNLRALYAMAYQLSLPNRQIVHAAIDAELHARGARTTAQHLAFQQLKADRRSDRARRDLIPF